MNSLFAANVRGKCYCLTYKLNANTTVKVQTLAGMTETAETVKKIGQGSMSAGVICALALDVGVSEHFASIQHEVSYGRIKLGLLL